MSAPDRRALIDRDQREPSIQWQCALLGVARSGVYRRSTSVAPLSAINDKTAATYAKPRPINSIIMSVGRIRRLGLLAEQVTSSVHSQMEIIEMLAWPNSITGQLWGWAGKHTVHLLEGET